MRPRSDTSPDIAAMQAEALKQRTPGERLRMAIDMSILARSFTRAGLRARHPDWSDALLDREVIRLAFDGRPLPRAFDERR
jgi:Rv0078B-related antitoxin